MKPTDGWEHFERHEELEDFLWGALKLRENNEGEWAYMSFTSISSTWELAVDGEVLATVMLECRKDEKVENLSISICNYELLSSNYIKPILDELSDIYHIKYA